LDDAPLTARLAAHIVQRHGGETGQ
jgi:hypothetical protein